MDMEPQNVTMMSNDSWYNVTVPVALSEGEYILIGIYLLILGCLSLLCNAFVILVLVKAKPKFHAIHNILILNVAISDLLLSSVAYPLWASTSFYGRWIWPQSVCTFSGFWCFALALNDMNTFAAIAICRYIIICKPQYEFYLKKPHAKYWILGTIYTHSLIITCMPLFGWSSYVVESFGTSCSIDWTSNSDAAVSYYCTILLCCYLLHVVVFFYCYSNIIKAFKVVDIMPSGTRHDQTLQLEKVVWYHKLSTSRSVTKTSLAMVSVFLLAWTPYATISIYTIVNDYTPKWMLVLPTMFAKSCTLLNPIVCAFVSSKFRKAARNMLQRSNVHIQPTNHGIEIVDGRSSIDTEGATSKSNAIDLRTYHANVTKDNVFIGEMSITLTVDNSLV